MLKSSMQLPAFMMGWGSNSEGQQAVVVEKYEKCVHHTFWDTERNANVDNLGIDVAPNVEYVCRKSHLEQICKG